MCQSFPAHSLIPGRETPELPALLLLHLISGRDVFVNSYAGAEGGVGEIGKKKGKAEEKERARAPSLSYFSDFPNPFMRLLRRLLSNRLR